MITHIGKQAHVARRSDTAFHLHKCVARFVSDSWVCWWSVVLIVIKISPCLSQLQLAKFSVFLLRHSVYIKQLSCSRLRPITSRASLPPPSVRRLQAVRLRALSWRSQRTLHIAQAVCDICVVSLNDWTGLDSPPPASAAVSPWVRTDRLQCNAEWVCACVCVVSRAAGTGH